MGYYIEIPVLKRKAEYLRDNYEASKWAEPHPPEWKEIEDSEAIICVVENDQFDAAAFCYSPDELAAFADPADKRPKTWLLMDKAEVKRLTGFRG